MSFLDIHRSEGADLDFNFWPSFADAMLALVFVLVLVIFLVAFGMQAGSVGLTAIREKQEGVARSIAADLGGRLEPVATGEHYRVCVGGDCPVDGYNDIHLQRITFSDRILFPTGQHTLSPTGEAVLASVGRVVLGNVGSLERLQIDGHTDTVPAGQYREGNLELGALRAIAVFRFLQEEVGIDPAAHLMSATTFGEFSPVSRAPAGSYSPAELEVANETEAMKSQNRRVELLLFYRKS